MTNSERLAYWQGANHLYEMFVLRLSNLPSTGVPFIDTERDGHGREACIEAKAWLLELADWANRSDPTEPPPHPRIKRVFQV